MAASTGCYVLLVVAEPVSDDHKQSILQKVNKGLLSWDVESTGCDLSGLELTCTSVKDKGVPDSDLLIQYSTESLGVEVLVNPPVSTLKQCVKNLLTSSISHKHIIHAGYTFTGSGSWILQNGTYSFQDFLDAFQDVKSLSPRGCSIHIHCVEEGDWTAENFSKDVFAKIAKVSLNPSDKIDHLPGSEHLVDCLDSVLSSQALTEIMEASPLVGNIRFNRPTLYLFPAGQGDCALFGINGFNMLIDGGFNRKPCAWEFIRHLDRLDAVLVTQLSEFNLCSMSTLMKRKTLNNTYPQIGYVFCNIAEGKNPSPTEELQKDRSELLVSVVGEGHNFLQTLNDLKLVPHQCWRDSSSEPFVLYHKVGHGTLEMHILSPPKDSKEMKDFLSEWSAYKEKFSCVKFKGQMAPIPLSHATSVCAILVWRPNDPKDTITRILFPGSAPQSKIFEGLEKLKSLDVLKYPTVTKASLSSVILSKPKALTVTPVTKAAVPNRKNTASPALSASSMASRNGDITGLNRDTAPAKEHKTVREVKKAARDLKPKPTKEVKKEPKDVKKEVKKDVKEVKKEPKKEVKPVAEKPTKTVPKKSSEATKPVTDVKKTTVKKTVKKDLSNKSSATAKTGDKAEIKKSKPAETKTAKEVINKKAAEAKTISKPKMKPTHAAAKPSPSKSKPTPVPKSPSKVTKAIAASATLATAAVAVGVAEFIESKREEEKEEILNVEVEEVEKEAPEVLQNGIDEIEEPVEIPASPLRQETMSPALSEPVSLTASDTLSSAPMETVSPTPPNDIVSPVEEKEVNEIKEIDAVTPTEDKYPEEVVETAETPVYDHADVDNADEGIVDDNADEKLEKGENESDIIDEQEDAGFDDTKELDVMATSFTGESLEPAVEEKFACETVSKNEIFPTQDDLIHTEFQKIEKEEITGNVSNEDIEEIEVVKHTDSSKFENIDAQLASASMEGSFCAAMTSEDVDGHFDEEKQVLDYDSNDVKPSVMETSMIGDEKEGIDEDYVQEVINQYKESTNDVDVGESSYVSEQQLIDHRAEDIMQKSQGMEMFSEPPRGIYSEETTEVISMESTYESSEVISSAKHEEIEIKEPKFEKLADYGVDASYPYESGNDQTESQLVHGSSDADEAGITGFDFKLKDEPPLENKYGNIEMQEDELPEADVERKLPIDQDDEQDFGVRNDETKECVPPTSVHECVVADVHSEMGQEESHEFQDCGNRTDSPLKSDYDQNEALAESVKAEADLRPEDESSEFYPQEGKQDVDEKDRDSAEDEEMIRHPTPPGADEFYQQVGASAEDEMRDPIGPHFIAPSAFRTAGPEAEEPLYEEEAEDSGSERSKSPIVEQPVFSSTDKANFPELVTVSGGTTPSEPQSPKSPHESKKGNIAALDVMEALSEHDCSESSQSPLVREGPNVFEHAGDVGGEFKERENASSPRYDDEHEQQAEDHDIDATAQHQLKGLDDASNIAYGEPSCVETLEHDLAPESEMHSDRQSLAEVGPPKFDPYEEESDLAYQPESDQFSANPDEIQHEDRQCEAQQARATTPPNDVSNYHSELNDYRAEAETFDRQNDVPSCFSESGHELAAGPAVPAEFANATESEFMQEAHATTREKVDPMGEEMFEQYSHESSTFASESSYRYHSETPEQNRYSSASTVELDNSKHSNENISNIEPIEVEGPNVTTLLDERAGREELVEQDIAEQIDPLDPGDIEIRAVEESHVGKSEFPEHEQFHANGYDSVAAAPGFDDEPDATHPSSNINGKHYDDTEPARSNGDYTTFTDVAQNKSLADFSADPHYQSDSPEDNSMRNDSPPDVPSPTDPKDPLESLSAVPPPGYDGITKKFAGIEGYGSDNLNFMSGMPPSPKNKYALDSENPYGGSSDEDEDSSSLPGNVSPYAYTNKAYNQEDDADGNHIYKQDFRIDPNAEDGKLMTSFDVNNPHAYPETAQFESQHVAPTMGYSPGFPDMHTADAGYDFRLEEWGKPMGLPTPPESGAKTAKKPLRATPTSKALAKSADKRSSLDNGRSPAVASKLTSSPLKKAKEHAAESKPIYVDLAYVPHHGDPNYSDVEFFKKIRARYYVFSGIGPSKEVLNALLEAKKSWKEDLEVTIIPTYETDTLGYWLAQNQDTLAEYSIEVAPSASRCTVNLQDHETSCAAYRLEF